VSGKSVAIALVVLAIAAGVVRVVYLQGRRSAGHPPAPGADAGAPSPAVTGVDTVVTRGPAPPHATATGTTATPEPDSVPFLIALGEAMVDAGDPVTHVGATLEKVAAASGLDGAQIVVLPTALIVSAPGAQTIETAVSTAGRVKLRLDQIDAVFQVVRRAAAGGLDPAAGLAALAAARALPPAYGRWVRLLGFTLLSVGIALLLHASSADLALVAVLGLGVGTLQMAAARVDLPYQVFAPVLSAFAVSVLALLAGRADAHIGVLAPVLAPLVTFLPGALLTTSVLELATGQMISGAGRLAAGGMQLLLLALGILAGAQLVGVPGVSLDTVSARPLGPWAPWVGVALFGAGVLLYYCPPRASAGWVLLVLYVAYAGQVLGGLFLGSELSAFVGALAMTPVAMYAASQRRGPATLVSFLPAFWLLVPGALGLTGVASLLGSPGGTGLDALGRTATTMVAIAFGVLLGLASGAALNSGQQALSRGWASVVTPGAGTAGPDGSGERGADPS